MKKTIFSLAAAALAAGMLLASCGKNASQAVSVVPVPVQTDLKSGEFELKAGMTIGVAGDSLMPIANYLAGHLNASTGLSIDVVEGEGDITLRTAQMDTPEGYTLKATSKGVEITGGSYSGVVAGISTLRQLFPAQIESATTVEGVEWKIPAVEITDAPAFAWRGIMLDVSRHFYTPAEIKEFLDLMALYKLNKFHWHLTDDQGWRVEIKKYPKLTENGAWRKFNNHDRGCLSRAKKDSDPDFELPADRIRITEQGDTLYGGYYTQDEIRDIVAYAGNLGIDVVPEIDMPGHMLAAVSNYKGVSCFDQTGWGATFSSPVCPGKESAMEFCKNVYDELIDLFPYEYVHIGGDEVEKTNWKKCPDCQKRMAANNLKNEEELQSWFIHQMEAFINSKGKKMIGWDEILEGGLSNTATVMWWRTWSKDAPERTTGQGNKIVYTPNSQFYLDYQEDKNSIDNIIGYNLNESLSDTTAQKLVMGFQGNIWCEWIPSRERMHYMAVPRLLAIAELGWAQPDKRDVQEFRARLSKQFERLNVMEINYRIPDLEGFNATNVFTDSATLDITCLDPTAQIRYTTDGSVPTAESTLYTGPVTVTESTDFTLATFRPSGKRCDVVRTKFIKESYAPACEASATTPGLVAEWYDYGGEKCSEITSAKLNGKYDVADVTIPADCKGNIGLVINGYINIPADGIYTFALLSDDGSLLIIDGATVIDNDGPHSPREIVGQKALAKGLHQLQVQYFDHNGGQLQLVVTDEQGNSLNPATFYLH